MAKHHEPLRDLAMRGVYHFPATPELFREALEVLWCVCDDEDNDEPYGDIDEQTLKAAREHFEDLYLIEVEIQPANALVDWGKFTQFRPDTPRSNWQVAYAERPIDEASGRWVFFFHYLDLSRPLITPLGEQTLPRAAPLPSTLSDVKYEVP
jgi:hypothetical protein